MIKEAKFKGVVITPASHFKTDKLDSFIDAHPHAVLQQSRPWRELVGALVCGTEISLVAHQGEQLTGYFPIIATEGPFGRVLNSLPYYGSPGGILALDSDSENALLSAYGQMLSAPNIASATVIENVRYSNRKPFPANYTDTRISHITTLPECDNRCRADVESALADVVKPSAHRNIKKAKRDGCSISQRPFDIDVVRQLHEANMLAQGATPHGHTFFSLLPHYLSSGRDFKIWAAEQAGDVIAVLMLAYFKDTIDYIIPATMPKHRQSQAMALLIWEAMCQGIIDKYRLWNWQGTWTSQEGLARFKRKWGAVEQTYFYHTVVKNPSILKQSAAVLSEAYPGFFVVPFKELDEHDHTQ